MLFVIFQESQRLASQTILKLYLESLEVFDLRYIETFVLKSPAMT